MLQQHQNVQLFQEELITSTVNPTSITAITTIVIAFLPIFIVVRTILVVNNNPVCHLSNYSGTKSYGAHNTTTTISGEFSFATATPNTFTISVITYSIGLLSITRSKTTFLSTIVTHGSIVNCVIYPTCYSTTTKVTW